MSSQTQPQPLHIVFFPMMAAGHMIPMVDAARLFAARGVKATIVTTPANAPVIDHAKDPNVNILLIPFPSAAIGLPAGIENFSAAAASPEFKSKFLQGLDMFRHPFDRILTDLRPDCVVTDMFFPWSADVAAEHGVPRLVFHGSCFSQCVVDAMLRHNVIENLPADVESFVVPGLPDRIEMLKSQIPDLKSTPGLHGMMRRMKESMERSYGVVANSFYELEPEYVRHCREVVGWRTWHVGPVSLCNLDEADMIGRGGSKNKISSSKTCLEWLDGKQPGSVLYVCFGSQSDFTAAQLNELAVGLEVSGCPFMWVVSDGVLPEAYEERVEGRGIVVKGWAPQVSILSHQAVGGFLTHCGWNSSLEGITAALPMITWPLGAEQFCNERLLVDVIGVGVAVGIEKFAMEPEDRPVVGSAVIERAVGRLMGRGEEAERRRRKARELKNMANAAVSSGGSSFVDMGNLIKELTGMTKLTTTNEVRAT